METLSFEAYAYQLLQFWIANYLLCGSFAQGRKLFSFTRQLIVTCLPIYSVLDIETVYLLFSLVLELGEQAHILCWTVCCSKFNMKAQSTYSAS